VYLESRVKKGKKKKKKKPGTFGGPNQWDKNATTFMCEKIMFLEGD
jgi:hypothetical protein